MSTIYWISLAFFFVACLLAIIFEDEGKKRGRKPIRGFRPLGSVPNFKSSRLRKTWLVANVVSILFALSLIPVFVLEFGFGVDGATSIYSPIVLWFVGIVLVFKSLAWSRAELESDATGHAASEDLTPALQ